jgi:hypothetical protein
MVKAGTLLISSPRPDDAACVELPQRVTRRWWKFHPPFDPNCGPAYSSSQHATPDPYCYAIEAMEWVGPFANTSFHPQSPCSEETRRSRERWSSSRAPSPRPPPSPTTSAATTPMPSEACTSTSSATTPTAARLLALTVCLSTSPLSPTQNGLWADRA